MYALGDGEQLSSSWVSERDSRRQPSAVVDVPTTAGVSALDLGHASNVVASFKHVQSLTVGVSRVVIGLLCLVFNVVNICYIDQVGWVVYVTGNGFWTGCAVSRQLR